MTLLWVAGKYHGGQNTLLDFKPLWESLLLDLVDQVEVEPLAPGRDHDVLVVILRRVGDVGVDGECLWGVPWVRGRYFWGR